MTSGPRLLQRSIGLPAIRISLQALSAAFLSFLLGLAPSAVRAADEPVTPAMVASPDDSSSHSPITTDLLRWSEERLISSGQPSRYRITSNPLVGYGFSDRKFRSRFALDVNTELALPQFGLMDLTFGGAVAQSGDQPDALLELSVKLPLVRGGIEYSFHDQDVVFRVSAYTSLRRGGLLGLGDGIRADYAPGPRSLLVGLTFTQPWRHYRLTRPRATYASMPAQRHPASTHAESVVSGATLAHLGHAMKRLDENTTPNLLVPDLDSKRATAKMDRYVSKLGAHLDIEGHSALDEEARYENALRAAFIEAASGDTLAGDRLTRTAQNVLLRRVLAPFDRLLGQKKKPFELDGLSEEAAVEFSRAVADPRAASDAETEARAEAVFAHLLRRVRQLSEESRDRWNDSRLVWLPLQLGIPSDLRDSQEEIDRALALVVDEPFTDANDIRYLLNDQFFSELMRTIRETREYHVLIIHDFRGLGNDRLCDHAGWMMAVDGYVDAFIRAVREIDGGTRDALPEFMLFLDEHYYRVNRSEQIISFLETLAVPQDVALDDKALQAKVREGQRRLLAALDESPSLHARGREFIQRHVKVHVNITNPYDPTCADDALMRDHRKLAFRDVYEDDPSQGEAVFTGLGVGEHYLGPYWEDRSLVIRGPDLALVKTAARDIYLSQGYRASQVPWFLRARELRDDFAEQCAQLRAQGWDASVLTLMNQTGYGHKRATVLKAAIYNLMPPGALLLIPDSVWTSDFWAGMILGAALRGCAAYPIAPAADHAPSSALPTLQLTHDTFAALLRAAERLREPMRRAGGDLRIGLYTYGGDVNNDIERVDAYLRGVRDDRFPAGGLRFSEAVLESLASRRDHFAAGYGGPVHMARPRDRSNPLIHMKAQLFLSRTARSIMACSEWDPVIAEYLRLRLRQTAGFDLDPIGMSPAMLDARVDSTAQTLRGAFLAGVAAPAASGPEGPAVFVTVGSHNQDRRSMLLDGEALVVVAGDDAYTTLIDFALIMGAATWPKDSHELAGFFPARSSFLRNVARWMRDLI